MIAQLAFAVLLLTGAGLAYRSLSLLGTVDFGFNKEQPADRDHQYGRRQATKAANLALLDRLRDRIRGVRGIGPVAYRTYWNRQAVQADGSQPTSPASTVSVGAGYLEALGLAPLAGREFADHESGRTAKAAMISRSLAESLWPQRSALGRTLHLGARREPVEVVGVTQTTLQWRPPRDTPQLRVSVAATGLPPPGEATFHIRYAGDLATIAPAIRRAVLDVDNRVPVTYLRTMETTVNEATEPVRLITIWLTLFAVGSLAIAVIGQYAMIAFDMRRRTRDFGVRIALGASSRQILGSVIGEGLRWTATGLAIGFALSAVAGRAGRICCSASRRPTRRRILASSACSRRRHCWPVICRPARGADRSDPGASPGVARPRATYGGCWT